MTSISLIPAYRRDARKRHRRLRRWGATCAGYVAFLVATYAFCTAVWGANGRTLDSQFQHTAGEIAQADQKIIALEKELRHNERLLAANRVLADQPDWSLLLALLSHALQDDVGHHRHHYVQLKLTTRRAA